MSHLTIPSQIYTEMLAHLTAALPNEGCGLLGGIQAAATKAYGIRNVAQTPRVRYQMDGQQQLHALLDIESRKETLVAIFHSHPNGPDLPSATDLREAYYPSAVYLIGVPDGNGSWQVRGFYLYRDYFKEVEVVVTHC